MKDVLMNKQDPVTKLLQLPSLLNMSSVKHIGIGMSIVIYNCKKISKPNERMKSKTS